MVTVKASSLAATGGRRQVWSYPKDSLPRESFLFDLSGCSSPILKVCLYLTGLRTCSTWTAYHQCFSKTIGGNHLTSELSEMGIQAKWEYKLNGNTRWDMQEADQKTPKKKKKKHGKEMSTDHQEKLLLISGNLEGHTMQGYAQAKEQRSPHL